MVGARAGAAADRALFRWRGAHWRAHPGGDSAAAAGHAAATLPAGPGARHEGAAPHVHTECCEYCRCLARTAPPPATAVSVAPLVARRGERHTYIYLSHSRNVDVYLFLPFRFRLLS